MLYSTMQGDWWIQDCKDLWFKSWTSSWGQRNKKNCPQIGQEWQVGNTVHHKLHTVLIWYFSPYCFFLQTGLRGRHRRLYPVETNKKKNLILKNKKGGRERGEKKREERLFENLIWIWTLDLTLNKPSCFSRTRWLRSTPNTFHLKQGWTLQKSKLN